MLSLALTSRATVLLFTSSHVLVLMVMLALICISIGLFSSALALLSELAAGSPGGSAIEHAKSKMSLHAVSKIESILRGTMRTDDEAPPATHTSWTPRSTPKSTPSCAPTSSILCQKIQVAVYVEFTMLGPLHRDRPDAVRLRMCTCACAPVRVQAELGLGNSTRHGSVRRTKYATFPMIRSCTCFTGRGVPISVCARAMQCMRRSHTPSFFLVVL